MNPSMLKKLQSLYCKIAILRWTKCRTGKYLKAFVFFILVNSAFYVSNFSQFPEQSFTNEKVYGKAVTVIETGLFNFDVLLGLLSSIEEEKLYAENIYNILEVFSDIIFSMKTIIFCKVEKLINDAVLKEDITVQQKEGFLNLLQIFFSDDKFKKANWKDHISFYEQIKYFASSCYNIRISNFFEKKEEEWLKNYRYIIRQYFLAYSFISCEEKFDSFDFYFIYLILSTFSEKELSLLCRIDKAIGTSFYEKCVKDKKINWDLIACNIKTKREKIRRRTDSSDYMSSSAGSLDLSESLMELHCCSKPKCQAFIDTICYIDIRLVLKKNLDNYFFKENQGFRERLPSNPGLSGSFGSSNSPDSFRGSFSLWKKR